MMEPLPANFETFAAQWNAFEVVEAILPQDLRALYEQANLPPERLRREHKHFPFRAKLLGLIATARYELGLNDAAWVATANAVQVPDQAPRQLRENDLPHFIRDCGGPDPKDCTVENLASGDARLRQFDAVDAYRFYQAVRQALAPFTLDAARAISERMWVTKGTGGNPNVGPPLEMFIRKVHAKKGLAETLKARALDLTDMLPGATLPPDAAFDLLAAKLLKTGYQEVYGLMSRQPADVQKFKKAMTVARPTDEEAAALGEKRHAAPPSRRSSRSPRAEGP